MISFLSRLQAKKWKYSLLFLPYFDCLLYSKRLGRATQTFSNFLLLAIHSSSSSPHPWPYTGMSDCNLSSGSANLSLQLLFRHERYNSQRHCTENREKVELLCKNHGEENEAREDKRTTYHRGEINYTRSEGRQFHCWDWINNLIVRYSSTSWEENSLKDIRSLPSLAPRAAMNFRF